MRSGTRVVMTWMFSAIVIAGIVGCAIHLWGGIFYLNPVWYYVPPVSALLLFVVVARPRTINTTIAAYALAGLFIASYALENWRWVAQRLREEGWFFFPDGAEALMLLSLLIAFHVRAARDPHLGG
jgi:hypothetical protein